MKKVDNVPGSGQFVAVWQDGEDIYARKYEILGNDLYIETDAGMRNTHAGTWESVNAQIFVPSDAGMRNTHAGTWESVNAQIFVPSDTAPESEMEAWYKRLDRHDWLYHKSDDNRTFVKGVKEDEAISAFAHIKGGKFKDLYVEFKLYNLDPGTHEKPGMPQ